MAPLPATIERATPVYRAIMLEIERRRQTLGLSMDGLSDEVGCADRYYAKALHPDTPSGRQARWETVQEILDTVFPGGFDIKIEPKVGGCLSAQDLRRKIRFAAADTNAVTRRKLMSELGRKGAAARSALSPEQRREIALKAAATKRAKRERLG